jgi:hypothetical protein
MELGAEIVKLKYNGDVNAIVNGLLNVQAKPKLL